MFKRSTSGFLAANQNFVASPVSALVLLSALLTARGPQSNTATELCKALVGRRLAANCYNLEYPDVEKQLNDIRTGFESAKTSNKTKILTMSNGAFIKKNFTVFPGFTTGFAKMRGDHVEMVRLLDFYILYRL